MGLLKIALIVAITAIAIQTIPTYFKPKLPKVGSGYAAPGWQKVANIFRNHLDNNIEQGAAFTVYYKGEMVVEFSGGYADPDGGWGWSKETLTAAFSCTKGLAALLIGMLVDRGLLEYDKPVANYWPEFAQNGKEKVTVRQLMSHQAGLAVLDEPFTVYDILQNPQKVSDALAKQKPLWKLGDGFGYHSLSIGLYADQLIRRVDTQHRDIAQFFQEEVAQPFGIDFYIGLPKEENFRVARLQIGSFLEMFSPRYFDLRMIQHVFNWMTSPLVAKTLQNPSTGPVDTVYAMYNPNVRETPCGSSRGFGTAIGLAKLYGILANGGTFEGQRLISQKTIDDMVYPVISGRDHVFGMPMNYSAGMYLLESPVGSHMFGSPGHGGQMGFADKEHNIGWAYLTNYIKFTRTGQDPRSKPLIQAIYNTIKDIKKREK